MNITPQQFIKSLKDDKTEKELNKKEVAFHDGREIRKLIKYGHDLQSAKEHLETDYSNGFTVCGKCGSFYYLGDGFTKHLSNGCLHCEGTEKHDVYLNSGGSVGRGKTYRKFEPRYMSRMFDDGMHYCKDKLQIELFKNEIL